MMLIIPTTFCQHCETTRSDSNLDGRCRFCNTLLYKKEIELPELSSSDKEIADKYMEVHRRVAFSSSINKVLLCGDTNYDRDYSQCIQEPTSERESIPNV